MMLNVFKILFILIVVVSTSDINNISTLLIADIQEEITDQPNSNIPKHNCSIDNDDFAIRALNKMNTSHFQLKNVFGNQLFSILEGIQNRFWHPPK